jgi:hypothetical protein
VGVCGGAGGEVGFSLAQRFEAVTVAPDAALEEVSREPSVFRGLGRWSVSGLSMRG